MKIRKAKKEDMNDIITIMIEIAELHEKGRKDMFKKKEKNSLKKELTQKFIDKNYNILVATKEEKIVGILIYKYKKIENHSNLRDAKILWIEEIGIKEEYKRKGIGTILINKAKEMAVKENCVRVELNCWGFNKSAIEFYKNVGMREQRINMEIIL